MEDESRVVYRGHQLSLVEYMMIEEIKKRGAAPVHDLIATIIIEYLHFISSALENTVDDPVRHEFYFGSMDAVARMSEAIYVLINDMDPAIASESKISKLGEFAALSRTVKENLDTLKEREESQPSSPRPALQQSFSIN